MYEFGEAPKAKTDGFGRIITCFRGTEKEACTAYLNSNVAIIRGAMLHGQVDSFEFAVMEGSPKTLELASAEREMTINKQSLLILPTVGSRVTVEADGKLLRGVVTGHDSKDGKPIFDYQHDHVMPDGSVVKADKWAWLDQLIDMTF